MTSALHVLDHMIFGNSLLQWSIALGVTSLVLMLTVIVRRLAHKRYAMLIQTEQLELLELPLQLASTTSILFLLVLGLFIGSTTLELGDHAQRILLTVLTIAIFWQTALWASTAALAWIELKQKQSPTTDRAAVGTLNIIGIVIRVLIWSIAMLLTLDNLGVNVTALIAGMGIGGIAIALAVQNVLGDLLASLSIALDKPFVLGDFLVLDDFMGSVEYIGIKSVRLRSLSGEQLILSNTDLLASRLRNFGRMHERRVVFSIGVTYDTSRDALQKIPTTIGDIIKAQSNVRFDRCHLAKFGSYSIDFECVYYVSSAEYNTYMDTQQEINLRIHEAFERAAVEFAYPTQRLLVSQSA